MREGKLKHWAALTEPAVFNYWEPTHYLSHGYGLQTWEYSPVYAIRSWAYVGLHTLLSRGFSELPNLSKVGADIPRERREFGG